MSGRVNLTLTAEICSNTLARIIDAFCQLGLPPPQLKVSKTGSEMFIDIEIDHDMMGLSKTLEKRFQTIMLVHSIERKADRAVRT